MTIANKSFLKINFNGIFIFDNYFNREMVIVQFYFMENIIIFTDCRTLSVCDIDFHSFFFAI